MASTESFCLTRNKFQESINKTFRTLREDPEFADVTLACEDGQQVEAHRVILSASSTFFKNLLRINKHKHPLIYMRGMKSVDLLAIVDFLYYGETNIFQENLENFLEIAEELKLNGIQGFSMAKPELDNPIKNQEEEPTFTDSAIKIEKQHTAIKEDQGPSISGPMHPMDVVISEIAPSIKIPVFSGDFQELDDNIKSMITKKKNGISMIHACTVCGKEGYVSQIKKHIETNHVVGVTIPCNFCKKVFRSRDASRQHKLVRHSEA